MTLNPAKGHTALRSGRVSSPGAEYFLTICTDRRRAGLDKAVVAKSIIREMHAMEVDRTMAIRCATIMPDHIHLFIVLGPRLSVGKVVQRLKAKTAVALRNESLKWERDFFDHRLRLSEESLPLFLYIYLNPHRKNLCVSTQKWPWFMCRKTDWEWLQSWLDQNLPPPEWLA